MPALSIVSPEIDPGVRGCAPENGAKSSLRALLRKETQAAHKRLDMAIQPIALRDAPQYRRFLEAHAEALLPLEATLVHSGVRRLFPDWDRRVRSPALAEDITRLGGTVPPFDLLRPLDTAGLLGAMYVLEGSRLGATILLDIVSQSPDPVVRDATAYLSQGAQKRLWPSFVAMLEHHAATVDDIPGAVRAARQAFAVFEVALLRAAPPVPSTTAIADRP